MIGCSTVTLHEGLKKHKVDTGVRDGISTAERKNKKLRQAKEILRLASAFVAQAELDRLKKK